MGGRDSSSGRPVLMDRLLQIVLIAIAVAAMFLISFAVGVMVATVR